MRLKKLHLHNYKQHKNLEIDFSGNIIAIIGANGKGKSNLIGAFQFLMTGEQPDFNKADLTTWGEDIGYVEGEFEHDSLLWNITRYTSSAKATLKNSNGEEWTGSRSVDSTLSERVGIDLDIARQSIFVNQAQIDSVLFNAPSARELAFQRLVGIGHSQKIHDTITKFMNTLPIVADYDMEASALCVSVATQHKLYLDAETDKNAVVAELANIGTGVAIEKDIDATNRIIMARIQCKTTRRALAQAEAGIASYVSQIIDIPAAEVDSDLEAQQDRYDANTKMLKLLEDKKRLNLAYNTAMKLVEQAKLGMEDAKTKYPDISSADIELAKLESDNANLATANFGASLAIQQKLLGALSGTSGNKDCPLCGSDLSSTDIGSAQLEKVNSMKIEYSGLIDKSNLCASAFNKLTSDSRKHSFALESAKNKLELATNQLKSATVPVYTDDIIASGIEKCNLEIESASKRLADIKSNKLYIDRCVANNLAINSAMARCEAEADNLKAELDEYVICCESYSNINDSAEDYELSQHLSKAKDKLALISDLKSKLSGLEATSNAASKQSDDMRAKLDVINAKRASQSKLVELRSTLTDVKTWFHYENGPHMVTSAVMKELTPNVNFFLSKLEAPFLVVADLDSVGFRYQMTDGTVMPESLPTAKSLSGAQRNMLALSFRLASYTMFAAKLGMLVLDEPTAHLDSRNVGKLGELLARLQKIAVELDLQVLVVSHHDEILPFCDSTINLGK